MYIIDFLLSSKKINYYVLSKLYLLLSFVLLTITHGGYATALPPCDYSGQ